MIGVDLSKYVPMKAALQADLGVALDAQDSASAALAAARRDFDEVTRQVEKINAGIRLVDDIIATLPKPEPQPEPVDDVIVDAASGEELTLETPQ